MSSLIERIVAEHDDYEDLEGPLKKACILKYRDIILETLGEYQRKGNFIRIYPGKNSN